ncbi:MAG: hypothetical protein ACXWCB_10620 [Acidimicrobiales bacterium]
MIVDTEATTGALHDLRRARRQNRIQNIHWIDALYRVYVTALVGVIAVIFAAGKLPDEKLSQASLDKLVAQGPAALGLLIAVAVAFGLRSGGRGGPLTLEAPVVQHELLAPVPRETVVRGPAVKQLRFMMFSGTVVGALAGVLLGRQLPGNILAPVAYCAVTGALIAALAVGAAMVTSGRRFGWWVANGIALVVIAWSVADILAKVKTSPLTWLAGLAFWSIEVSPVDLVAVVLVIVVVVVGLLGIGNLSIEAARRRAGLVSQLRFAVTLQDMRTVVLLRRQLAQEKPRNRPWIRMRRGGRLPPIWRRDWQSYLRFPVPRLLRMLALAVVAGLSLGAMWRGATAMFIVAGLALYLAAYDAVEPIAQEVDHPTRWESFPDDSGRLLILHLPAAIVTMIIVCAITAASALILVPGQVVGQLAVPMILTVAVSTTIAAAVSTSMGSPNVGNLMALGPDLLGFVLAARLVAPPAMAVASLMPLLAAGRNPDLVQQAKVSNAVFYPLILIFGAGMWLRYRKPSHL